MAAHRINRVEVELHGTRAPLARTLCEHVSQMHPRRIAPVIERVLDERGTGDALVRLDQLELDLGTLPTDDFDDAFVARLEQALREALAQALRQQGTSDHRTAAAIELLETFALTGNLPWWAPDDDEIVARHFARAAAHNGDALVGLLRRIASDAGALDRIARACDPDALAALVERTRRHGPAPRAGAPAERWALLSELIEPGTATRGPSRTPGPLAASPEPPARQGHADRAAARARDGARPPDARPDLDAILAADRAPGAPAAHARDDARPPDARPPDARPDLAVMREADRAATHARDEALPLDARPDPDESRPELVARQFRPDASRSAGDVPAHRSPPAAAEPHGEVSRRQQPPSDPTADPALPPEPGTRPSLPAMRRSVEAPAPARATTFAAPPAPPDSPAARRRALARLDEVYVGDAGLVILWPFLERYFARVGVLGEDRRFLDDDAQLQAIALLDLLATGDPEPLEFRLPLAKLLCGWPLESEFQLERPLTPDQLAEGEHLLTAVIDRAAVLGELSIPGLRAAFLLRSGALTTRDGAWLLQVERQTHDALLDRFPWSWTWIKLPWMPDPLRVEW